MHLNFALESVGVLYIMLSTIRTQLKAGYFLLELGKLLPAHLLWSVTVVLSTYAAA